MIRKRGEVKFVNKIHFRFLPNVRTVSNIILTKYTVFHCNVEKINKRRFDQRMSRFFKHIKMLALMKQNVSLKKQTFE